MSVYINAESNPATQDSAGNTKTKIYWKALNAESCQATGGDSDKTWKKTEISTSGSYTTTNFEDGESRTYSVKCSDEENNDTTAEVSVSADSSTASEMSGSLFAKSTSVKSGESSSLYWLSSNTSQCYLYSDQDSFSGDAEYVTSSSDDWFAGGAGYYLKTSLTKTTGQSTATFNAGETFKYKLICGDSNGAYSVLSDPNDDTKKAEVSISSEDGEKETYKTHSQKEYNSLSKEAAKVEIKLENLILGFTCILNDYTQSEDVSKSECSVFEESSFRPRNKIMFKKIITYFLILAVVLPVLASAVPLPSGGNIDGVNRAQAADATKFTSSNGVVYDPCNFDDGVVSKVAQVVGDAGAVITGGLSGKAAGVAVGGGNVGNVYPIA